MSTSRQTTVWCDTPDCGEWYLGSGTAKDVRSEARKLGWRRRKNKDECPSCAAVQSCALCPARPARFSYAWREMVLAFVSGAARRVCRTCAAKLPASEIVEGEQP